MYLNPGDQQNPKPIEQTPQKLLPESLFALVQLANLVSHYIAGVSEAPLAAIIQAQLPKPEDRAT
jgi:hypothetical protein